MRQPVPNLDCNVAQEAENAHDDEDLEKLPPVLGADFGLDKVGHVSLSLSGLSGQSWEATR